MIRNGRYANGMSQLTQEEQFELEQALLQKQTTEAIQGTEGIFERMERALKISIGLVVAWVALFLYRVYAEMNTAATGHMIDVINKAHSEGHFEYSGMEVALGFSSGLFRFLIFDDLAKVPEAIVIAFATTAAGNNTQAVMLSDPPTALNAIVSTVANNPSYGVEQVICEAMRSIDTSAADKIAKGKTCQGSLCTSSGHTQSKAIQEGVTTGIAGAFAASAVVDGPIGPLLGIAVGGIGGYFLNKKSSCSSKFCSC